MSTWFTLSGFSSPVFFPCFLSLSSPRTFQSRDGALTSASHRPVCNVWKDQTADIGAAVPQWAVSGRFSSTAVQSWCSHAETPPVNNQSCHHVTLERERERKKKRSLTSPLWFKSFWLADPDLYICISLPLFIFALLFCCSSCLFPLKGSWLVGPVMFWPAGGKKKKKLSRKICTNPAALQVKRDTFICKTFWTNSPFKGSRILHVFIWNLNDCSLKKTLCETAQNNATRPISSRMLNIVQWVQQELKKKTQRGNRYVAEMLKRKERRGSDWERLQRLHQAPR